MGRVIKGANVAGERYEMKPRLAKPPVPDRDFEEVVSEGPPPEAAVDLSAARAEADRLIEDATADAQALLEEARQRSLELIDEAERGVTAIENEARTRGHEQGSQDGRAAAEAEMEEMLATMRGLVEMARAERHKIIESSEGELLRLALSIAERVLNAHVAMDQSTVLEMTRSAIARVVNRETVTVRVNPADIEVMREHRDRLMAMNDVEHLRLIEDQRVDRGGVVIETDSGTIDGKISTQLREVRRVLMVDDPITIVPAQAS